jgi:hypothetical protein
MQLNPERIATREKLILAGLFLSKYDAVGLKRLGFESFLEAFNVIGYALGAKPASIKNYRDEFAPLFPNRRKGWHKRSTREYCLKVYREYKGLDLDAFTGLVKSFVGFDENVWSEVRTKDEREDGASLFAKRLITGLAAERYLKLSNLGFPNSRITRWKTRRASDVVTTFVCARRNEMISWR